MKSDKFEEQERIHRELINHLQNVSEHIQPTEDFVSRTVRAAERQRWAALLWAVIVQGLTASPASIGVRFAFAIVLIVAVVGAIPQYVQWIDAYFLGVPSPKIHEAKTQETLWEKNFACATRIDQRAENYAAIAIDNVVVVTWACPSGDVLVTLESPFDLASKRSVWVPLRNQRQADNWLGTLVPMVFAAQHRGQDKKSAQMITVLCQRWLPDRFIKRRVRFADQRCFEETINPRTGHVIKRIQSSCDANC